VRRPNNEQRNKEANAEAVFYLRTFHLAMSQAHRTLTVLQSCETLLGKSIVKL
jgi:hypothetical protein